MPRRHNWVKNDCQEGVKNFLSRDEVNQFGVLLVKENILKKISELELGRLTSEHVFNCQNVEVVL